jgi:putative oxidoreductase
MSNSTPSQCCNILSKFGLLFKFVEWKLALANKLAFLAPLTARFVIAHVFWSSGILKLPQGFLGIGKGNWDSTLILFEYEHPVPLLSPEIAAFMGTSLEIICPILLVLGLGTRTAASLLLIMTAVIEFTYQHSMDHVYWASLLLLLIVQGGGYLSLDRIVRKKFNACEEYTNLIK